MYRRKGTLFSKNIRKSIFIYKYLVFFFGKKDQDYGRFIFDLKIEQTVVFNLETESAEIEFCKEYPGEKFNFVLESQVI